MLTAFSASVMTPINLTLLSLFVLLIYLRMRPRRVPDVPKPPPPIVFRTFVPTELLEFDGTDGKPIYFGVRGRVFDVSSGRNFYGPGGPYSNFAGRDASRGLAKGSFDASMLTEDLEAPLDELQDLTQDEVEALRGWEERFMDKYMVVGDLVAAGERKPKER
jgi:membrane-associated progesterone receptor component